jgi:hypothetical protein
MIISTGRIGETRTCRAPRSSLTSDAVENGADDHHDHGDDADDG